MSPTARHGELLLELLSEEIPARMQRRAIEDLTGLLRDRLAAAQIPAVRLAGHVTPRRLAVIAEGIPARQPDRSDERRGPRTGAPSAAIEGFLRSTGLRNIAECAIRDTGRGEFYFAVLRHPGQETEAVLPELIGGAIIDLAWPRAMRWPGAPLPWIRPLVSIVCLYNGAVVPLALGGIPVGRATRGHRFLAPGEICVRDAADYREQLQAAQVVLDEHRRREAIAADLDRRAAELGVAVKPDPGLLDEVTGLVECPVVLAGAIDRDLMLLPAEVLATAMRAHQKYFSCLAPDGAAAPYFLFVANNRAADGGSAIIAGNERVLRARLADARFFFEQDRKTRLADRLAALKERVYHDRLGTLYDKAQRMARIAEFAAPHVPGAVRRHSRRAALLAKADLSTGMVGEFPELQGVMGGYYALHDAEEKAVADAIGEHYKPQGPADTCPSTADAVVVALADKLDHLLAFIAIGEKPSGSRDPFALRRAAQGIIRLVLENQLRLPLLETFGYIDEILARRQGAAAAQTGQNAARGASDTAVESLAFVVDRLKVHLREAGVRHDLIAAAFAQAGRAEDDLVRLLARVEALRGFLETDDGANLLTAHRRAANIVAIEEKRDGRSYGGAFERGLLEDPAEKLLASSLDEIGAGADPLLRAERFAEAMAELARLRRPVDELFAKVTVNTEAPRLRENRLRLLSAIREVMNRVADFAQIEG